MDTDSSAFVATPNLELFIEQNNPYHTKENTYSELRDLLSQCFREVEIIEPTCIPTNPTGRVAHEERFARGEHGRLVTPDLEVFGRKVDQRFLSNTHSFHCFARGPIA